MYRSFTSGGTERDVSRWLKEMGYRGQGLKKESLLPLCRGEMTAVWDALFVACRPPDVVKDMKRKVEIKLQRQAALETRQKTQEDVEKRRRQIERIQELRQRAEHHRTEIERLKSHVSQLTNDLGRMENEATRQKAIMENKLHRSKVLSAATGRTDEAIKSIEKEMEHLEKHNSAVRKSMQEGEEIGMADFESVVHAMYDFTSDALSQKLQKRPVGKLLSPEEALPKIEACPEVKDPAISRLMTGMGRLYAHHSRRLTYFFKTACEDALFGASQHEAKYTGCAKKHDDVAAHAPQTKAIEEMQIAHLKSFMQISQMEEANERRLSTLKRSPTVQELLTAVEACECRESFNGQLDSLCLKSEIEVLEKEIEKLELGYVSSRTAEEEAKRLHKQMLAQVEQSQQIDILLLYIREQFCQFRTDFEAIAETVKKRLELTLPSAVSMCLDSLKEFQEEVGKEFETFRQFDFIGKPKSVSLSEPDIPLSTSELPLLQRWDTVLTASANGDGIPYWTSSLREVAQELRQVVPLLKIEAPDALFSHVSEALQSTLLHASLHEALMQQQSVMSTDVQCLTSHAQALAEKDQNHKKETQEAMDKIDTLVSQGHEVLHSLESDVSKAHTLFNDQPGFLSVPWQQCDGKSVTEWVTHLRHAQSLEQDSFT